MKAFLLGSSLLFSQTLFANADCKAQFLQSICYVQGEVIGSEETHKRTCLETPPKYTHSLSEIYDHIPQDIRPTLCHLKRLFIEQQFEATGYAGDFWEPDPSNPDEKSDAFNVTGWVIGLNEKRLFINNPGLSEWTNRKEQTLFGIPFEDPISNLIPQFHIKHDHLNPQQSLLLHVLVHEIGHLIDFANRVNSYEYHCADGRLENCSRFVSSAWGLISWNPDVTWRDEVHFGYSPLCYYLCRHDKNWQPVSMEDADSFFQQLFLMNGFVSSYAAVNPTEDFAEPFALHFVQPDTYEIKLVSGETLVIPETLKGSLWIKAKLNYVEQLFDPILKRVRYEPYTKYWRIPKKPNQPSPLLHAPRSSGFLIVDP